MDDERFSNWILFCCYCCCLSRLVLVAFRVCSCCVYMSVCHHIMLWKAAAAAVAPKIKKVFTFTFQKFSLSLLRPTTTTTTFSVKNRNHYHHREEEEEEECSSFICRMEWPWPFFVVMVLTVVAATAAVKWKSENWKRKNGYRIGSDNTAKVRLADCHLLVASKNSFYFRFFPAC